MIQILLDEDLTELRNHPIKDGYCDLLRLDIGGERLLEIRMPLL
jgi:hypothetical protein